VIHAKQSGQLDLGADFFEAFPLRGVRRVLVVIDETAGQAPLAVIAAARQEHFLPVFIEDCG